MTTAFDPRIAGSDPQDRRTKPRLRAPIVDDDESLVELLCEALKVKGFDTLAATDGETGLNLFQSESVGLVILDLGIPKRDGFEVLARMKHLADTPVIILSGRHESEVKVKCLELGADDYVTKPFDGSELLARCRAALRHASIVPKSSSPGIREIQLDIRKRRVLVSGREVNLTRLEFNLLRELVANGHRMLDYRCIQDSVWGNGGEADKDVIHHLASRLRSKIEADPMNPKHIIAVPGVGYVLRE